MNHNHLNSTGSSPTKMNHSSCSSDIENAFAYPECWKDEARMKELLVPFRVRDVNPENYDSKMKFWHDIIVKYCEHKGSAIFCKLDLQTMFSFRQRTPQCLTEVLEDMMRKKKIRLHYEYACDPENSWAGWAINSFVKRPLSWGLQKLKNTVWANESNEGLLEYVHVGIIKKLCSEFESKVLQNHKGKLLHYDELKKIAMEAMHISEDCLPLCLHTLHCQHKIGLEYKQENRERQVHLVKIPLQVGLHIAITESDHAIHNLQITQISLIKKLEQTEEDIKLNEQKARECLKENKRHLAKTYLRKKHLLEKNHEKRSTALHNIDVLLCSVDEAQSNGQLLDAYKIGSKALQNALNESGLKYDNIDEVLADVRDTMEQHKEIQDAFANADLTDVTTDNDDELERELKEILGDTDNGNNVTPSATAAARAPPPIASNTISNTKPNQVVITDNELLSMLEGLEVASHTPTKTNITQSAIFD